MGPIDSLMILAAMLFLKHLCADGPLQTSWQLANKGKLLHPGGFAHAGVHVALTGLCLALWYVAFASETLAASTAAELFALILAIEFVVHYLVDWTKCAFDARLELSHSEVGPDGQRRLVIQGGGFFYAFLADQTAHSLTYIAIIAVIGQTLQ